ncbi:MAG: uroporphyrinogen decarboxylase [Mojavia pulchra JT2-VF2]|jgi:uroporphyrinogen decarboxylase|uniref:Uroporphyrinogen decarboxylase n=1 Tax=Mojavia pulchra JT2-VF2 TaxID=287848 RepID=A0A951UF84_9NOST|nr:uroporphyrinogen decarboxylase [Mojavia pulchra JT2-VF2]
MGVSSTAPNLLRAARGEVVDRPPVWMMRQAGRYMKAYRDLREKYPSFRDRSEIPEVAIEVSLQPWRAFQPDGVILFSDIVTPLPGLGIDMDIAEGKGPIIYSPIRTQEQVDHLRSFDPEASLPFIKTILQALRQEVGNQSTVLGFVGAPWTLAAYAVEGKGSKTYSIIKNMAFSEPAILHDLLGKLADAIAVYVRYQIDCGAQVVQMFDSWAGQLSPQDYDVFALPYQQRVFEQVKQTHPDTPLILLVSGSAGVLERMAKSGADVVTVDWTVDMADARARLGKHVKVQGNLDPGVLFGSKQFIRDRILDTVRKAGNWGHILNLGHGVMPETPEENVAFFFETAKQLNALV